MFKDVQKELRKLERLESAKALCKYFKTGPGEYGEGDVFLGLKTDEIRSVAKRYLDLPLSDVSKLLSSKVHEDRTCALMILTQCYGKSNPSQKEEIFKFYLKNLSGINNWDLVDTTAPGIVGEYLFRTKSSRRVLYDFAKSPNLWKRRVAIMSTFYFIRERDFSDTLKIAEILLDDKEDLIHKAVGWMLREVGNRDLKAEEKFLKKHLKQMPRTALRYAIEKFPQTKRKAYLLS